MKNLLILLFLVSSCQNKPEEAITSCDIMPTVDVQSDTLQIRDHIRPTAYFAFHLLYPNASNQDGEACLKSAEFARDKHYLVADYYVKQVTNWQANDTIETTFNRSNGGYHWFEDMVNFKGFLKDYEYHYEDDKINILVFEHHPSMDNQSKIWAFVPPPLDAELQQDICSTDYEESINPNPNVIVMSKAAMYAIMTLAHELGHYLFLGHCNKDAHGTFVCFNNVMNAEFSYCDGDFSIDQIRDMISALPLRHCIYE